MDRSGTVGLPPELVSHVERILRLRDRAVLGPTEVEDQLLSSVFRVAEGEFDRTVRTGSSGEPEPDAEAWDLAWDERRRHVDELGARYAMALTEHYEVAENLGYRVFASPQWELAREWVLDRLLRAVASGGEAIEDLAFAALRAASCGVLPRSVRAAVRDAPVGSNAALVDMIEADREGDVRRVAAVVAGRSERGCVSAALDVLDHRRRQGRPVAALGVAAMLDLDRLADIGAHGGITHIAVQLLADGADAAAIEWSSRVDDAGLLHAGDEADPRSPSTRLPGYSRNHWPGCCIALCQAADARLLGPLAFVDWTGGLPDRARARAAACDSGADSAGWSSTGVELLAGWVLSRDLEQTALLDQHLAALDRAREGHVQLGLLGVQIHSELAALYTASGDDTRSAAHAAQAERCRAKPAMMLHFEPFQFPALLDRLPALDGRAGQTGAFARTAKSSDGGR